MFSSDLKGRANGEGNSLKQAEAFATKAAKLEPPHHVKRGEPRHQEHQEQNIVAHTSRVSGLELNTSPNNSPSPLPSPAGRGGIIARCFPFLCQRTTSEHVGPPARILGDEMKKR